MSGRGAEEWLKRVEVIRMHVQEGTLAMAERPSCESDRDTGLRQICATQDGEARPTDAKPGTGISGNPQPHRKGAAGGPGEPCLRIPRRKNTR